jgi:basic membrane protein A
MNTKPLVVVLLCLLGILISAGPHASVQAQRTSALSLGGASEAKKLKVALVLPGSINDQGFNESAYNGLMALKDKLGVDVAYSESTPTANFERVIRGFADDGNDIIIGQGFEFGDIMAKVSLDYANQYFIVVNRADIPGNKGKNVVAIEPAAKDAAFLVGVLAGLTTKSNKVGAVMGFDFPNIVMQVEAFRLGMKSVNAKAELQPVYIGTFDDVAKGKEAALAQISAGADVIYHIADSAGIGVIQAADEKGIKVIGWGVDQNKVAPKTVIATQVIDTAAMMLQEVKLIQDGKFDDQDKNFSLDTAVVGVSDYHGLVPDDVAKQVELWKQAIIKGGVQVPVITDKDGAVKLDPLKLPDMSSPANATASVTMNATP